MKISLNKFLDADVHIVLLVLCVFIWLTAQITATVVVVSRFISFIAFGRRTDRPRCNRRYCLGQNNLGHRLLRRIGHSRRSRYQSVGYLCNLHVYMPPYVAIKSSLTTPQTLHLRNKELVNHSGVKLKTSVTGVFWGNA